MTRSGHAVQVLTSAAEARARIGAFLAAEPPKPLVDYPHPLITELLYAVPTGDGTSATIATRLGTITLDLFCRSSPVAAQNFVNLAHSGFYNGLTFHRLVPRFLIQGGDPAGDGTGSPPPAAAPGARGSDASELGSPR